MEWTDVSLRLGAALLAGCALGLNRDLHGKPTGVRTLGLVSLASAIAVLMIADQDVNATSRVIQGLLTGIGFIGAGVIVHGQMNGHAHGLTTAACVWLTACVGAACGAGHWRVLAVGGPLIVLVLIFGGPLEKLLHGDRAAAKDSDPKDQ
jgi:putative Mg2+ transporter-C (MgtC) family protein